jgi:hypothetical protein
VTRNKRRRRLTIEKLAVDCLDVRELQRAGIFKDHWVALPMVSLRWPRIEKNMRLPRLDPIEIPQSSRPSANPSFMDTVPLRQRPALAALYFLRAARGAIVQGDGRLLLPPLYRKSALRKPAPEQEGAGLFAGLPTAAKARRFVSSTQSGARTAVRHEAKDLQPAIYAD